MSGPKHLWSGDWQEESRAARKDLAERRPTAPPPEPTVTSPPRPRQRRPAARRPSASRLPVGKRAGRARRSLGLALVAVLGLAAGAWGLTSLLGSAGSTTSTNAAQLPPAAALPAVPPTQAIPPTQTLPSIPQTPTAPSVTPAPAASAGLPHPVYWLGMEIQTVPPGAAVIETVRPQSPAGLGPGDVIVAINHRPINGTGDIAPAIRGLRAGDVVQLQIGHGSGLFAADVTLAAPPSYNP